MSPEAPRRLPAVDDEQVRATTTIEAAADDVFAVLADPTTHASVDGTGWVSGALDREALTHVGQVFRMAMFHPGHPDGHYEIANLVIACERPTAIAWKPGVEPGGSAETTYGGWTWRYDLEPLGPGEWRTTLTYYWSGATDGARRVLDFPPFPLAHLEHSLDHLAALVRDR